jgi:hypothetical protein
MPISISELLSAVQPDPWRREVGFSPEVDEANQRLFDSNASEGQLIDVINDGIFKHQPCLFGKIAAKCGFMRYCILTERDLQGSDDCRGRKWDSSGARGRNGFVGSLGCFERVYWRSDGVPGKFSGER